MAGEARNGNQPGKDENLKLQVIGRFWRNILN